VLYKTSYVCALRSQAVTVIKKNNPKVHYKKNIYVTVPVLPAEKLRYAGVKQFIQTSPDKDRKLRCFAFLSSMLQWSFVNGKCGENPHGNYLVAFSLMHTGTAERA